MTYAEELVARVSAGLAIPYPERTQFRWKDRVKAWQDERGTWWVRWSSRIKAPAGEWATYAAAASESSITLLVSTLNGITDFRAWKCGEGERPRYVSPDGPHP